MQRGRALLWAGLGDPSAGSGKGTQQAARYLQRLHRMLRLEETAMEVDICRWADSPLTLPPPHHSSALLMHPGPQLGPALRRRRMFGYLVFHMS